MSAAAPHRAPRVVGTATNMQRAAEAAAERAVALDVSALRIFDQVPANWHGVIPVAGDGAAPLLRKGEVAVYEVFEPHLHALVDGGLYVIEYQSPKGGASREMFARWFVEYGSRLNISRQIVRAKRSTRDSKHWYFTALDAGASFLGLPTVTMSDGPYDEMQAFERIIGVVAGIYRGSAA